MKPQSAIFEGNEIRRVYDEATETWWFSVVDIVQVLTQQRDFQLARNYWKVLKNRLVKEGSEAVTNCNRLKMVAADGKQRPTDVATAETLLRLVQSGFGMEASWDGEFDGTKHGWAVFFRILKHALERHKGKKSYQANLYEPLIGDATKQSAWTNLSKRFAGSIDSAHEPDDVVVISQAWNEALIWFTTTKKFVSASFVTYGMELDRFEAAKLELEATMKQAAGHSA